MGFSQILDSYIRIFLKYRYILLFENIKHNIQKPLISVWSMSFQNFLYIFAYINVYREFCEPVELFLKNKYLSSFIA